jgi:quinol monooxygenase YgiN
VAPVTIITRLVANPGRRADLMAEFAELHDRVAEEEGTLVFAMHEARDEPDVVVFYEVYADEEALRVHRASPVVEAIVPRLGALVAVPPQVTYATPVRTKGLPSPDRRG